VNTSIKFGVLLLCVSAIGAANAAEDMSSSAHASPPTKEQREQMATLHEHMAACLRSEKSMSECHEAARKECRDTMGDRCGMMMKSMMEHRMNKQRENGTSPQHPQQ